MRHTWLSVCLLALSVVPATSVRAQIASGTTIVPTRVIAGHEIEENAVYYIEMTAPHSGIQPADRLTKVELSPVGQGKSVSMSSFFNNDTPWEKGGDANVWMNIPEPAATFRTTDRAPRFLIWTTQDNSSRIRVARCRVKKDFRTVQLDPHNERLNFFKDQEGSQAFHFGYTPPVHVIAVKGPLKPGEYVLSAGPGGPVATFGIDASNK